MNRQLPTPVRLERHDSINLTTGVVTRSDVAPANVALDNLGFAIAKGLKINNLRALHLAIMRSTYTPWEVDLLADCYREAPESEIDLPAHRDGMRMNDLESLYSAILINADHGLIFCGRYADVDDHIAHCK